MIRVGRETPGNTDLEYMLDEQKKIRVFPNAQAAVELLLSRHMDRRLINALTFEECNEKGELIMAAGS